MSALRAYILSYDIANAKRLRAMHKLAKAHGRPLQYSVFACFLRREDRVRLAARIEELIHVREDRVVLLDIGAVADRESWLPPIEVFGRQEILQQRASIII
jgi:CRISPR-associated protein Cas2